MDKTEINKRMAEIMGWPVYIAEEGDVDRYEDRYDYPLPHVIVWTRVVRHYSSHPLWSSVWNPAEDLNQAKDVAEKLRNRDPLKHGWTISSPPLVDHLGQGCFVAKVNIYDPEYWGSATTPALALCEAVIEAVKGEDDD